MKCEGDAWQALADVRLVDHQGGIFANHQPKFNDNWPFLEISCGFDTFLTPWKLGANVDGQRSVPSHIYSSSTATGIVSTQLPILHLLLLEALESGLLSWPDAVWMRSHGKQDSVTMINPETTRPIQQKAELDLHMYGNLLFTEVKLQSSEENMNHSIILLGPTA